MNNVKRLYRSETDRVIAGVCSGIAEYLGVDAVVIRLVFIFLGFFGGSAIIVYIICWIFIPTQSDIDKNLNSEEYVKKNSEEMKVKAESMAQNFSVQFENNGRIIGGMIIVLLGFCFLTANFNFFKFWDIWRLWPLIFIVAGLILIFRIKK